MNPSSPVDPLLERLQAGEVPLEVRRGAARGALPLAPSDLLRVQCHLARHDPAEEVRREAEQTILGRAAPETAALLAEPGLAPAVAEFFCTLPAPAPAILEALTRNPACPDAPLAALARRLPAELADIVVQNQVRLLRSREVVEALEANPALTAGQVDRLREFRRHFLDRPEPLLTDSDEGELGAVLAHEMAEAMIAAEAEQKRVGQPEHPNLPSSEPDEPEMEAAAEEGGEALGTYQRILGMAPADKVKLAFRGSAEERALLIRDPNRVVASAVLKSPRLTDKEVENFVKMRSLSDEVLRRIAMNRDWTRNYSTVLGLIRNPKTPPGVAMPFLSRLTNRDMNILAGDRNIPEVIRQQARRTFMARTQGRRAGR